MCYLFFYRKLRKVKFKKKIEKRFSITHLDLSDNFIVFSVTHLLLYISSISCRESCIHLLSYQSLNVHIHHSSGHQDVQYTYLSILPPHLFVAINKLWTRGNYQEATYRTKQILPSRELLIRSNANLKGAVDQV